MKNLIIVICLLISSMVFAQVDPENGGRTGSSINPNIPGYGSSDCDTCASQGYPSTGAVGSSNSNSRDDAKTIFRRSEIEEQNNPSGTGKKTK